MKPRLLFLVALVMGLASVIGCKGRPKPIPDTGPLRVTVAYPKQDKIEVFTDLTGSVFAPESVQVRARVSGFIKEVPLEDLLKTGKAMVDKDKTVLFKIDPVTYDANLKEALAQVEVARADHELAQKDEARAKLGFDRGVTSKQEYETFVAKTAVAKAKLEASNSPVIKAKQNLEWTTVTAPISGRVDKAYLTAGNVVTGGEVQGTILTTINSVDPMYVYFDVDDQTVAFYQRMINEGKIKGIDQGGSVKASIKLLGDDKYNKFADDYPRHGEITFAGNQLNPTTGTLAIRGVFPNHDKMLIPGRYVRGRVPLDDPYVGLLIPDAAVGTDQGKKVVYIVNADNTVEEKPVVLGPLTKGLRIVRSGITKDDRVIIRGIQRVQPGEPVEPENGTIDYPQLRP